MTDDISESPPKTHSGPFTFASASGMDRAHNEDVARVMGTCAWVLDGADDPLADESACRHDALWYVDELDTALSHHLSESRPLDEDLAQSIREVAGLHRSICNSPSRQPCATVAIVRVGRQYIDYLVLGDASLLIGEVDSTSHLSDKRLQMVAPEVRNEIVARLRAGHGYDDPGRGALLRSLAEAEREARNSDDGYWVASYAPDAAFRAITKSLPVEENRGGIALMSDGLERALSVFQIFANCDQMLKVLVERGPAWCIDCVRDAEMKDRSGQTYPRTKFSDDASAVVWTHEGRA